MHIPQRAKTDYFDYYDAEVTRPLPDGTHPGLELAADFRFIRQLTQRPVKFSFTGPFSLSRRIRDGAYDQPGDLVRALARRLNAEARELAEAGADFLQIDEPFLAGYPEHAELAVEAVNMVTDGVTATWALHVCYGNRYARPSWEGHYDFLFPAVQAAGSTSWSWSSPARAWRTCACCTNGTGGWASASSTSRRPRSRRPSWSRTGSAGRSTTCPPTA